LFKKLSRKRFIENIKRLEDTKHTANIFLKFDEIMDLPKPPDGIHLDLIYMSKL